MKSHWNIKKVDSEFIKHNSEFFKLSPTILGLLYTRGVNTPEKISEFINPAFSDICSPFLLRDMYEAVSVLRTAIEENWNIALFSDSDLDGITSLSVLYNLFRKMNKNIHYRFPTGGETYGLTREVIDEFIRENIKLVITLDSGIRDVDEIAYGKQNGIDFIVTDHHEPDTKLPDAVIINPKQIHCTYPCKNLAGVGVAFKLGHALLMSYLPGYQKRFIIITNNEAGDVVYSDLKDGIIEAYGIIESSDDMINFIDDEEENIIFVLSFFEDFDNDLKENFFLNIADHKIKIYEYFDFVSPFAGSSFSKKELSIEYLCELFNADKIRFENKISLLTNIFLEIQMRSSSKILDYLKSSLELVSLGTIADIMPLTGENRILVHYGMKFLSKTTHHNLSSLIDNKEINTKLISWSLAPFLNTPGRFGQTNLTADFFLETNPEKGDNIIKVINNLNDTRKELIQKLYIESLEQLDYEFVDKENLVVISSDKIPDGMAGLLANRIADKTGKPVIVLSAPFADGTVKGSGRCTTDFDFFSHVVPFSDLFEKIGGHPQAFGFTVRIDKTDRILNSIKESICNLEFSESRTDIDFELDVEVISVDYISSLKILEPYGKMNEEPVFFSKNIEPEAFTRFGKNMEHGRYYINNRKIDIIGWNLADQMEEKIDNKKIFDIVYKLENNDFRGRVSPRLVLLDID